MTNSTDLLYSPTFQKGVDAEKVISTGLPSTTDLENINDICESEEIKRIYKLKRNQITH